MPPELGVNEVVLDGDWRVRASGVDSRAVERRDAGRAETEEHAERERDDADVVKLSEYGQELRQNFERPHEICCGRDGYGLGQ